MSNTSLSAISVNTITPIPTTTPDMSNGLRSSGTTGGAGAVMVQAFLDGVSIDEVPAVVSGGTWRCEILAQFTPPGTLTVRACDPAGKVGAGAIAVAPAPEATPEPAPTPSPAPAPAPTPSPGSHQGLAKPEAAITVTSVTPVVQAGLGTAVKAGGDAGNVKSIQVQAWFKSTMFDGPFGNMTVKPKNGKWSCTISGEYSPPGTLTVKAWDPKDTSDQGQKSVPVA